MPGKHHPFGPSKLEQYAGCPGSYKLGLLNPGEQRSKAADEGTMLHERVVTGDFTGLDDEQIGHVEYCRKLVADHAQGGELLTEHHLGLIDGFDVITEGTADVLIIRPDKTGILFDWKFGRKRVTDAAENIQLAAYGAMAMQRFKLSSISVGIVQPRLNAITRFDYDHGDVVHITSQIKNIICRCLGDELILKAGQQCDYCRAAGDCPEAKRLKALTTIHSSEVSDPVVMADLLEKADVVDSMAKSLSKWADSVRFHAIKREQSSIDKTPGWQVVAKPGNRKIINIFEAFGRLQQLGYSAEEFVSACKVSLPDLEDVAAAKAKAAGNKQASGKKELLTVLSDLIQRDAEKLSIERVKQ